MAAGLGTVHLGSDLVDSIKKSPTPGSYSRVILDTGLTMEDGTEVVYISGNTTGLDLNVSCSYGTQAMADNILTSINGFQYVPYNINECLSDPSAEVGDVVVAEDVSSGLYYERTTFGILTTMEVKAPYQSDLNNKYSAGGGQVTKKDLQSVLGKSYSRILQESNSIKSEVYGGYAAPWQAETDYSKDSSVVYYNSKFYRALEDHTSGTTFDTSKWEEIPRPNIQSLIDMNLGGINITYSNVDDAEVYDPTKSYKIGDIVVYSNTKYSCKENTPDPAGTFDADYWTSLGDIKNMAYVKLNKNGVQIGGGVVQMGQVTVEALRVTGELQESQLNASVRSKLNRPSYTDQDVADLMDEKYKITQTGLDATHIESPEIYGGIITAGVGSNAAIATMSGSGFNISGQNQSNIIGLGYKATSGGNMATIILGAGVDSTGTDRGMIKKYPVGTTYGDGLWIGDSDAQNASEVGSGTGIYIDFYRNKIFKFINGQASELGVAIFG